MAAIALAAAVAAAFAFALSFLDVRGLAAGVAADVKAATGRELVFGGAVELKVIPRPALVLADVRFANASWGSQPWMVQFGRATAAVDLFALLSGKLRVRSIVVDDAQVLLETDRDGNGNWQLGGPEAGPPEWLRRLECDEIAIAPLRFEFRHGATARTFAAKLETAVMAAPAPAQPIRLRLGGTLEGRSVGATVTLGGVDALLAGKVQYPLEIEATLGEGSATLRGTLGQPLELAGIALDIAAQGREFANLAALAGRKLDPIGPFRVAGRLSGSPAALEVSALDFSVGTPERLELTGTGRVALKAGALESTEFELAFGAQGKEFGTLAALAGHKLDPIGPFRVAGRLSGTPAALEVSALDLAVGTPDRLELTATGRAAAKANAAGTLEPADFDLAFGLQGAEIGELARLAGESIPQHGRFRMKGRLAGTWAAPGLTELDVAIGAGERLEVTARGSIARVRDVAGLDVAFTAAAGDWWRYDERGSAPRLPPFAASGRLRDAPGGWRVDGLDLKVAGSRVDANLLVSRAEPRPRISGSLRSSLIDFSRIVRRDEARGSSAQPAGGEAASTALRRIDAALDVKVDRLVLPDGRIVTGTTGRIGLDGGRLVATRLQATAGGASITIDGSVADPLEAAGIDLRVSLQGSELAQLFKFAGGSLVAVGPYRAAARATGALASLRLDDIDAQAGRRGQRLQIAGHVTNVRVGEGIDLVSQLEVNDSVAAGRLLGWTLPRLPAFRASGRFTMPQRGFAIDDFKLALARTAVAGRVAYTPGEPRPRVTATLGGALLDLTELPTRAATAGKDRPLLAADVDADIRFERLVLPDKRALGPVSGRLQLAAGSLTVRELALSMTGAAVTLDGTIADPLKPAGLDLRFAGEVKRFAAVETFVGMDLPDLPPFKVSGRLTDVPDGYTVSGLAVAFPRSSFGGDLSVVRGPARYKLVAKLAAPAADIGELLPPSAAEAGQAGGLLLAERPLPLAILRKIDADLDLRVEKILFTHADAIGPLVARFTLAGGRLRADPVQLTFGDGEVGTIRGTIDAAAPGSVAWALAVDLRNGDLGQSLARLGRPGVITGGVTDASLEFTARGDSVRAIAGSLNGEMRVQVGPHRVNNFNRSLATGLVGGILSFANPFRETDPNTDVRCAAARVPIKDGVVISDRNVAVETEKYNAVLSGTVNLRTQAIDIAVTPIVTQGLGIGAGTITGIVRVRGTLAEPSLGVDPVDAARSAASVGAAVATLGGWWIADALLRRARADPSPCATALGTTR